MASNGNSGIMADTGSAAADNTTTPELRRIDQLNARQWAILQDNVNAAAEWCRQATANYEAIVGNLTADRHDPATITEHNAVLDAVHHAGQTGQEFAHAVEAAQAAFEAAAKGLERARVAEDAHAAFAGGPAKNFDAYAQQ